MTEQLIMLIMQVHDTEERRCVSCDDFPDTGMCIRGDSEFQKGFLVQLSGITDDEAVKLVAGATGVEVGMVRQGIHTILYRVCKSALRPPVCPIRAY